MKTRQSIFRSIVLLGFVSFRAMSQDTNGWGNPTFGARLMVGLDSAVLTNNSIVNLKCSLKNFSTNEILFAQTSTKQMYAVFLVNDSGESIMVNNPDMGDASERRNRISNGESHESLVPFELPQTLKPGHYRMLAKQQVFIFKGSDYQHPQIGELVSNYLDVQIR